MLVLVRLLGGFLRPRSAVAPRSAMAGRHASSHQASSIEAPIPVSSVDCVVIGAGVVGLACARALALAGRDVVIIEKETAHGTATSSRNSEVIHAGFYYAPGSLIARLCVRGRDLLYEYCGKYNVPHLRLGKLVVATSEQQLPLLHSLKAKGEANGVHDLRLLSGAEAATLEPKLKCTAALLSPSTGILDSHALMARLLADFEAAGGILALGTQVVGGEVIERSGDLYNSGARLRLKLRMGIPWGGGDGGALDMAAAAAPHVGPALEPQQQQRQQWEESESQAMVVEARCVINSAGLHAQEVAARIRGLPAAAIPPRYLAKGSYFSLAMAMAAGSTSPPASPSSLSDTRPSSGSFPCPSSSAGAATTGTAPFARLVYPVPEPGGLGIHYTLDIAGRAKFGPDVEWVQGIDYTVDPSRADRFYASVRRYLPGLPDGVLQPAYCGIRSKVSGPGEPDADFLVQGVDDHGVPGLVNLFGIGSPGLTSSLAIAELVHGMLLPHPDCQ